MLETPLCRILGIEHPILSAGMGGATRAALAAAVSNAGGCGQVTISGLPADGVRQRIAETRALTDRPFAANVILDTQKGHEVATAIEEAVPIIVLFWGDPAPYVEAAHRRGTKVIVQVGSVADAVAAAEAGVDVVIAQGVEAGGHVMGTTPLFSLLPMVVEVISPVPVVAAGGIVDGRGMAAALSLGAQGVMMGTRFLGSDEAFVHPEYQRRLLAAGVDDTVYVRDLFDILWPDAPHRVLRNACVDEWEAAGRPPPGERPGEGATLGVVVAGERSVEVLRYTSFTATPQFEGDFDQVPLWAGMSVGLVNDVRPAGEIVRDTVRQAAQILGEGE